MRISDWSSDVCSSDLVVTAITAEGLRLAFSGDQGLESTVAAADLQKAVAAMAVMRPLSAAPDARVDAYFKPVERHWLRGIVFAEIGRASCRERGCQYV